VLCVLLLRGPQTPGELRGRTERMHRFETLDDVQSTLQKLIERQPPLAVMLARQPGMKESRYAQLLAGPVDAAQVATAAPPRVTPSADDDRIAKLEEEVAALKKELAELKQRLM
jgi:hypothetical protein